MVLLGGCFSVRKQFPNPLVPDAANIWVGQDQETGRWSEKPGNANITIKRVDSTDGEFPPSTMGFDVDYSTPLHLMPGRHSIDLSFGTYFQALPKQDALPETVEVAGSGTIEALFVANHAYRITALWINGSASGTGTFKVILWDLTGTENVGVAARSWNFRGGEVTGPPRYVSP
jgi:hypothetical protein